MSIALLKRILLGRSREYEPPVLTLPDDEKGLEALRASEEGSRAGSCSDADTLTPVEVSGGAERFKVDARVISDAIIGLSDGLTVPFALTAGLSAFGETRVVIFGGFAELTAGAISMGLGGYLGAKSEDDSYRQTESETRRAVETNSASVPANIADIFAAYDVPNSTVNDLTAHLVKSPQLAQFFMHFQHTLAEPPASRAFTCTLTIALSYFIGGLLPLLPYFFVAADDIETALWASVGVMAFALMLFGYSKTCFVSGWRGRENVYKGLWGGAQMVVVGGAAAGSAMALVRVFQAVGGT